MIDMNDPEVIESLKYLLVPKEERIRLQSLPFDAKKNFFVPDKKEGFLTGEITKEEGDNATLTVNGNSVTVKKSTLLPMNPMKYEKCDDMADLTHLNDATVYHNLRERYVNWYIYTYSGLFCVTINPFKRLPLYTMKMVHFYRGKKKNEVPPHLYLVADNAYAAMTRDKVNQSLLITGESGAGKTENTKKVIQYFAFVAAGIGKKKNQEEDANKPSLEDQIVSANPVLEAYGNAKTTRNNNSSRFGKFIRIHFTNIFGIAGADIETYLLEKSRITYCMELERNYHIFYQLCSSAFPELSKEIQLEADASKYFFINQGMLTIDRLDDAQEMRDTKKAFDILMFTQQQQMDLFKITSAVANWGNTKWKQRPREEQAEADGTDELVTVAQLLGLDEQELIKGITKPRIKVGNEFVNKGQNKDQCTNSVGALSKAMFSRAFTWLVEVVNVTLDVKELKRAHFIGVLDIAGFETFEYNGFEQLCINFTNERLQQFFNNFMFVLEQAEYTKEGIVWETMSFGADLQATIDLIEKKMGIFAILEEECIVPKATDMTFKDKLYKQHLGKHASFGKPKPKKGAKFEAHFDLHHYAGVVSYSVDGWLEKNKDPINMTVAALFKNSKGNQLLSHLFRDIGAEEGGGGKGKSGGSQNTISAGHREQLNKLMKTLDATSPHFVRCIIPNELKTGGILDAHLVLHQLHCNGVLEGIRICRKGYPSRLIYKEFLSRYGILAAEASQIPDAKQACTKILQEIKLDTELYRVGLSKVLFKAGVLGTLEEMRDEIIVRIMTLLQSQMRRYIVKKNIKKMLEQKAALTVVQRNVKSFVDLRNWGWLKLFNSMKHLLVAAKKAEEERLAKIEAERQAAIKAEEERLAKIEAERQAAIKAEEERLENERKIKEAARMAKEMEENNEKLLKEAEKTKNEKAELENNLTEMEDKVAEQNKKNKQLNDLKKKLEEELNELRSGNDDFGNKLNKSEAENKAKDGQLRKFKDECSQLEDNVSKLSKEKKRLDEANNKTLEQLQHEEDKVKNLTRTKNKLEQELEEMEDNFEREKKAKNDQEKARRKAEGELKSTQATLEETERNRMDLEDLVKRKENEIKELNDKVDEEGSALANANRKIKELQSSLSDQESETDAERSAKQKSERQRHELNAQIEDLNSQLQDVQDSLANQVEVNKKHEAALAKMKRDMEEQAHAFEAASASQKKKNSESLNEMQQQVDQLQKAKTKLEKEKKMKESEVEEVKSLTEDVEKSKSAAEKTSKQYEQQLDELKIQISTLNQEIDDLNNKNRKLNSEKQDLESQVEDAESQVVAFGKMKSQLNSALEEAQANAESESRARASVSNQLKNANNDLESLKHQLEDAEDKCSGLEKQVAKAHSETQQWKSKYESGGGMGSAGAEEAKKKLANKLSEVESQLDSANNKYSSLEKNKMRLQAELDEMSDNFEKANSSSLSFEKKVRQLERTVQDFKTKCDDSQRECENAQRDLHSSQNELAKLRNQLNDAEESYESAKRDARSLADELKNVRSELSDEGRNQHDLSKAKKNLEDDKEELLRSLEEAERNLEQEQSKTALAQFELSNAKSEVEKRLRDKEEGFENVKRNHQRALESMEASLEAETKAKNDTLKYKNKLEHEVSELQVAVEHANRNYRDMQNSNKRFQQQVAELTAQFEDEHRKVYEASDAATAANSKLSALQNELDGAQSLIDAADKARRNAENQLNELTESLNDASSNTASAQSQKRKLEGDLAATQAELYECAAELKASEERAKKAASDAAKASEDLKREKDNAANSERVRKSLEGTVKELQSRLEQTEEESRKNNKRVTQKLDDKIQELESELESEHRRHMDTLNQCKRNEKRFTALVSEAEEEKKTQLRLQEQVDALNDKNKALKTQVEQAEEIAAINLSKFRKAQHDLEDAQSAVNDAEHQLSKLKAEKRASESQDRNVGRGLSVSRSYRAGSTFGN